MATKREAWQALQQHTPELTREVKDTETGEVLPPFVNQFAERFGIDAVEVEVSGERIVWRRYE